MPFLRTVTASTHDAHAQRPCSPIIRADLVAKLVASGRYQNASEVLREGPEDWSSGGSPRTRSDSRRCARRPIPAFADMAAGRYRTFDTADALEDHLSALSQEALADPPSNADAGQ